MVMDKLKLIPSLAPKAGHIKAGRSDVSFGGI